jgi:hypothetical protein
MPFGVANDLVFSGEHPSERSEEGCSTAATMLAGLASAGRLDAGLLHVSLVPRDFSGWLLDGRGHLSDKLAIFENPVEAMEEHAEGVRFRRNHPVFEGADRLAASEEVAW